MGSYRKVTSLTWKRIKGNYTKGPYKSFLVKEWRGRGQEEKPNFEKIRKKGEC